MADNPPARPDRPHAAQLVHFRIAEQVDRLKREPAWLSGSRNAITLVKERSLRVVLTVLKKGTQLQEHQTGGPFTLQVVSGLVRVRASGSTLDMAPGAVVALERGIVHEVEALEETAFLLTLVQPL
jgi:quercetin dioxygenase-like cupin family protein